MTDRPPNPGNGKAIDAGCICPVLDNAHGRGMPYPDGPQFWTTAGCPIHAPLVIVDDGGDVGDSE